MPELGPRMITLTEDVNIYGQVGGTPDSDLTELRLKSGESVAIRVSQDDGCIVFSGKSGAVYLPVSDVISRVFRKRIPFDRQVLEAQTGITSIVQLPIFLQEALCKMVEEVK